MLDPASGNGRGSYPWTGVVVVLVSLLCRCPIAHGAAPATQPALPLHDAARAGDAARVIALLRAGADVCARDADGQTALHVAAGQRDVEAVELLIF